MLMPRGRGSVQLLFLLLSDFLYRQELGADLAFDVARHLGMFLEKGARIVLALADALALVAVPGAGLLDDAVSLRQVDDLAFAGDAFVVHEVEFGLAERRRRPCS